MADPVDLSQLLPDTRAFLRDLEQNNDRAWFQANKARYDSSLKRPAEKLLAQIAGWLGERRGTTPRTKLFRPHRDVRFSEDKTPYHAHLHMMWSLPDGRAWMLGLSTSYATVGAGVMHFEESQLDRWREAVAGDRGVILSSMLAAAGWRIDPPALDRPPPPWPDDHPRESLLRHKGFVAWHDELEDRLAADPERTLREVFDEFAPLMDWLGGIV